MSKSLQKGAFVYLSDFASIFSIMVLINLFIQIEAKTEVKEQPRVNATVLAMRERMKKSTPVKPNVEQLQDSVKSGEGSTEKKFVVGLRRVAEDKNDSEAVM